MESYEIKGNLIEVKLDNGKIVKVAKKWVDNTIQALDTDIDDVLLMFLEDNGYLENEEQNDLDKEAKANKPRLEAKATAPKKKTQRERVVKENPTKELIIQTIANTLQTLDISNLSIENKAKLITFTLNGEDFKVDLVQKRKPKEK